MCFHEVKVEVEIKVNKKQGFLFVGKNLGYFQNSATIKIQNRCGEMISYFFLSDKHYDTFNNIPEG